MRLLDIAVIGMQKRNVRAGFKNESNDLPHQVSGGYHAALVNSTIAHVRSIATLNAS
jgi:hypothetical protein